MKKYLYVLVLCLLVVPAFGAGRSVVGEAKTASRVVMPLGQFKSSLKNVATPTDVNGVVKDDSKVAVVDDDPKPVVNRDKERLACLSNNIGVGNTFVWASKYSNTSNYANMVEDVEHPENNVCFVLVGMRSDDSRINTSDIQPRYFEWGTNITCGSWIDEAKMQERILDAKKKARTWGTIGGAVGGAGVGVGAMELFGNDLLSGIDGLGKLQGQEQYKERTSDWYRVKANELKQKDVKKYREFVTLVRQLNTVCNSDNSDDICGKYENLRNASFDDVE